MKDKVNSAQKKSIRFIYNWGKYMPIIKFTKQMNALYETSLSWLILLKYIAVNAKPSSDFLSCRIYPHL